MLIYCEGGAVKPSDHVQNNRFLSKRNGRHCPSPQVLGNDVNREIKTISQASEEQKTNC